MSNSNDFDSMKPHFEILKLLGKGRFGEVYLGRQSKSGNLVALKVVLKNQTGDDNSLFHEIEIQASLNHPNILKIFGFFEDEENIYITLVSIQ